MLAENLVDPHKSEQPSAMPEQLSIEYRSADENNDKKNSGLMAGKQNAIMDCHYELLLKRDFCLYISLH